MPAGFLGEAGRSGKRIVPLKPLTTAPPRARSKQTVRPKREPVRPDFGQLMADLKSGVSRLGRLAQKLASSAHQAKPVTPDSGRRAAADITKIIERELRTVSQLAPTSIRSEITKEYRDLADKAVKLRIPQSYAELLQAERKIPAAEALRPTSKAVRSLMQATQAIKQGRLPFLPKETRREAQKLLNALFSRREVAQIARSSRVPKMIENRRLVSAAVHGMVESARRPGAAAAPLLGLVRKAIEAPLAEMKEPRRTAAAPPARGATVRAPVGAQDLPRLAQALPSFATQGVAAGGAFLSHADEDVSVITRSDSPLVAATESGGAEGPIPAAPKANSTRVPLGDSVRPGATSARGVAAAGQMPSQSQGPVQVEGTMNIPELGNIVSKFTGFMRSQGELT